MTQLNFEEFCNHFHNEKACFEVLYRAKWPSGFCCVRCGHRNASLICTRRLPLYECLGCGYQASLITGTIMEGSRTPLHKWFQAIFLLASPDASTNAVKLSSIIKVTYKTAWLIMHKIRFAMSQATAHELLTGIVRVNAAVYGKPYNPTVNRHPQEHPLLVGASISPHGEITHVKMMQLQSAHLSPNGILRSGTAHFVERHVEASSDVTVETKRYNLRGHQPLIQWCRRASNWMKDVYHGIGPKHLQVYLDEFCYRLNHTLRHESAFEPLFKQCATTAPITYARLTRNHSCPRRIQLSAVAA
ncbi:IS1595 family transposase [Paenibacillus oenotherae]|uniref:IS1595 family transposase n=1 Tax=Paenibacillus oenotherae TaxID=1435645 RepID=A0ABS7D0U0_9BACL|nr:IS1595 family transposase [Paenibacillus oenotherae]MBW7473172.1 IS1595 family transposase [Paenibacillus oenotherae]